MKTLLDTIRREMNMFDQQAKFVMRGNKRAIERSRQSATTLGKLLNEWRTATLVLKRVKPPKGVL